MKTLVISEEQLTFLLKEFLKQYQGQFDHVVFKEGPGGYVVAFHQVPEEERERPRKDPDSGIPAPSEDWMNPLNPLSPISVFHDFGGSPSGGDFGGFGGGGSSGGGGASGSW